MSAQLSAALAILSALLATLGSLFLAYDYLADQTGSRTNPLRLVLRLVVPTVAGTLPGVLLFLLVSFAGITDIQTKNLVIETIALGTLAGGVSAMYMRDEDELAVPELTGGDSFSRQALRQARGILLRATTGLVLGVGGGVLVSLIAHTSVDNALTAAGSTGPLAMTILGVWPLITWTPTSQAALKAGMPLATVSKKSWLVSLPGVAVLGIYVGLVNGIFDARAPQRLYRCATAPAACGQILTPSAALGVGGTALVHCVLFYLGGIMTLLLWIAINFALVKVWDNILARNRLSSVFPSAVLAGGIAALLSPSIVVFGHHVAPSVVTGHDIAISLAIVTVAILLGGSIAIFHPIPSIRDGLKSKLPFSRFDAVMLACFALCILEPYIVLTNISNLFAANFGFPHSLGVQTVPPIQIQRIVVYSRYAVLLGLPVALAVGGLTRSVYRWAMNLQHRTLGAFGIGLTLVAFFCQLVQPIATLVK